MIILINTLIPILLCCFFHAFDCIVCFAIEDVFRSPVTKKLLMLQSLHDQSYAAAMSAIVVTAIVLAMFLVIKYRYNKNPEHNIVKGVQARIIEVIAIIMLINIICDAGRVIYWYMIGKADTIVIIQTIISTLTSLIIIAYLVMDHMNYAYTKPKFFFLSSASFIVIGLIISMVITNRYAHLSSVRRVYMDSVIYEQVQDIERLWKNGDDEIYIGNTDNVKYQIVNDKTVLITFNTKASQEDRRLVRLGERLFKHSKSFRDEYNARYQIPGTYTKEVVRK